MDDSISRRMAINVVSEGCQEWRGIFERCEEKLLALPSAQPEIIRCRDCKWWDQVADGSKIGYCHAIKHCHHTRNWEIDIYRKYEAEFFCANGERRTEEEEDETN